MNKYFKFITPTILIGSSIALPIGIFASKNTDEPSTVQSIKLSTKQGSENLIEIFTDGYDFNMENELMPDPSYKDFKMFKHAYTSGYFTVVGKITALGGLKEFNPYKLLQRNNNYYDNAYLNTFCTNEATNAMSKHLNVERSYFDQVTVMNGYDNFSEGSKLAVKYYGDTEVAKNKFPGIDYVNWSGARDENTGEWGISNMHPDKPAFELAPKKIKISDKPGRLMLQTDITHEPHVGDENGNGTFKSNLNNIVITNHNMIGKFFDSLKNIKDDLGRSVYDNSLIVVWGDHGNGERVEKTIDTFAHTNLIIKFPDQVQNTIDVVDDKLFYIPQLNNIIDQYFSSKPKDPFNTIFNQPAFSLTRTIGINATQKEGNGMFKWHYDNATQKLVQGDYLGDFDKNDTNQAQNIYKAIADGGDYND